jgi:hypothetical protein
MSGPGYAKGTTVDVSKSRAEIDHVLVKNGASSVGILNDSDKAVAVVAFTIRGAKFRLEIPMPLMAEVEKVPRPRQWSYWDETRRSAWKRSELSQLERERWRAVLLLIKSKLEIVRIGLSSVEREFMADLVLPSGQRAEAFFAEAIRRGLEGGDASPMLGEGEK